MRQNLICNFRHDPKMHYLSIKHFFWSSTSTYSVIKKIQHWGNLRKVHFFHIALQIVVHFLPIKLGNFLLLNQEIEGRYDCR